MPAAAASENLDDLPEIGGSARFTLTEDLVVDAACHHYGLRLRQRSMRVFFAIYGVLCAVLFLLAREPVLPLAVAAALPLALWMVWNVTIPRMARRHFRQSAALQGENRVE